MKEIQYTKIIRRMVNKIFSSTRLEFKENRISKIRDSKIDEIESFMRAVLIETYDPVEVELLVTNYFESLFILLDKRIEAGLQASVGIMNRDFLNIVVSQNVQLITTLHVDMLKDIQLIITDSVLEGSSLGVTRSKIAEVQQKGLFRAETIAITETAKASSQHNRRRFKELGITKGRWSSARDKRTRKCHNVRNGKEYDLEKGLYSSCDGKTLQVGQEVRCRCAMLIVL